MKYNKQLTTDSHSMPPWKIQFWVDPWN